MNIKLYENKSQCCGCSACYSICPVNAIVMEYDEEGFCYPRIEEAKCIKCKKCESVCPPKKERICVEPKNIYASKNKDESVRAKSSSGGLFSLLAEYVEKENGVIYGAAYDDDFNVKHMRAQTLDEWKKFCVSKYVASDIVDIYEQVKYDLQAGKKVLFSGTPCQVDGLKRYIQMTKTSPCDLITCDIVCHGTPSPKIWSEYLALISRCYSTQIGHISFRNKKEVGWHNSTLTIWDTNRNILLSEGQVKNFYFQLFFCHEILRPHCHKCEYANYYRPGDITLGDYWGIEKEYPMFDDDKGVSLVMINTVKGIEIWDKIKEKVDFIEVSKEQCRQPNLEKPSELWDNRKEFWKSYQVYGLKRIGQRRGYLRATFVEKIVLRIYGGKERILRLLNKW